MTLEANKVLVQGFIEEVMNAGNTAAIADFCVAGSMFAGGLEGQIKAMKTAFPDLHLAVDDIVAEGNKVVVRMTMKGTNTGPLVGLPAFGRLERPIPPTGQSTSHTAMYMFWVSDGRIMRYAAELDQIALLRQMGWTLVPPSQ